MTGPGGPVTLVGTLAGVALDPEALADLQMISADESQRLP